MKKKKDKDWFQKLYSTRIQTFTEDLQKLQATIGRITFLRFLVFVAGIVAIWYFYHHNQNFIIYSSLAAIIIFIFLVRKHAKLG